MFFCVWMEISFSMPLINFKALIVLYTVWLQKTPVWTHVNTNGGIIPPCRIRAMMLPWDLASPFPVMEEQLKRLSRSTCNFEVRSFFFFFWNSNWEYCIEFTPLEYLNRCQLGLWAEKNYDFMTYYTVQTFKSQWQLRIIRQSLGGLWLWMCRWEEFDWTELGTWRSLDRNAFKLKGFFFFFWEIIEMALEVVRRSLYLKLFFKFKWHLCGESNPFWSGVMHIKWSFNNKKHETTFDGLC